MDFSFDEEAEKFRQEVREFLAREWQPDPESGLDENLPREVEQEFRRKLADRGWLALSVPKEYGGAGLSPMHLYVLSEELAYHRSPRPGYGPGIVAPTLIKVGTEEQKKRFLPGIVKGEIDFCLGYTEPNAGSDLAAVEARAVEDGDYYLIRGQKTFTSWAHRTDYCWLATRTDPNVPKHKGITIFIIDMKSPGITVKPIWTMGDWRVNAVYWDDVRVPKANLIGEVNKGWYYMAMALDLERLTVNPTGMWKFKFDLLVDYVKETKRNGKSLKDDPDVRDKLARLSCDFQVVELLQHRSAWLTTQGIVPNYEASAHKIAVTELAQKLGHLGTQILGLYGQLQLGSKFAPLHGLVEEQHRIAVIRTIAAGSNEIQRNIIATRGLGLPR